MGVVMGWGQGLVRVPDIAPVAVSLWCVVPIECRLNCELKAYLFAFSLWRVPNYLIRHFDTVLFCYFDNEPIKLNTYHTTLPCLIVKN